MVCLLLRTVRPGCIGTYMQMEQTLEIQLKTHKMSRLTDQQLNDDVIVVVVGGGVHQYGNTPSVGALEMDVRGELRNARLCLHACKHRYLFACRYHIINVTIGNRPPSMAPVSCD